VPLAPLLDEAGGLAYRYVELPVKTRDCEMALKSLHRQNKNKNGVKTMPNLMRWSAWLCCCCAYLPAFAEVPYCPPSFEAPLEEGYEETVIAFPRGHLFQPLLADPKESRFYLSYRSYQQSLALSRVGVIGFGETFPLLRRVGGCATDGLQLDIVGGGVARFVLDGGRNDLIDADYTIAIPVSGRRGNISLRTRVFHESSHLGENELFQSGTAQRLKRDVNGFDMIGSYDEEKWRIYFGAEYLSYITPAGNTWGMHGGAEYYSARYLFGGTARWVGGVDLKAYDEYDFETDVSIKAGFSFGGRRVSQQHLQLMLTWYDGHANEGVLFSEKVRYYGAGLYFGF
jgi:hypothetical protein